MMALNIMYNSFLIKNAKLKAEISIYLSIYLSIHSLFPLLFFDIDTDKLEKIFFSLSICLSI